MSILRNGNVALSNLRNAPVTLSILKAHVACPKRPKKGPCRRVDFRGQGPYTCTKARTNGALDGRGGCTCRVSIFFKKCLLSHVSVAYLCPCRMSNLRNGPVACRI